MSKYKHGKQTQTIEPGEFAWIMKKGIFLKPLHKGFLALLYYTGCRVSEILSLKRESFELTEEAITVSIKASKKGVERPPFIISKELSNSEWIVTAYLKADKGERVFPFSRQTAWRIVKRLMPKHYPHFFRLNRVVSFLDEEKPRNKIRIWFGWKKFQTVDNYLGYSKGTTRELSEGLA